MHTRTHMQLRASLALPAAATTHRAAAELGQSKGKGLLCEHVPPGRQLLSRRQAPPGILCLLHNQRGARRRHQPLHLGRIWRAAACCPSCRRRLLNLTGGCVAVGGAAIGQRALSAGGGAAACAAAICRCPLLRLQLCHERGSLARVCLLLLQQLQRPPRVVQRAGAGAAAQGPGGTGSAVPALGKGPVARDGAAAVVQRGLQPWRPLLAQAQRSVAVQPRRQLGPAGAAAGLVAVLQRLREEQRCLAVLAAPKGCRAARLAGSHVLLVRGAALVGGWGGGTMMLGDHAGQRDMHTNCWQPRAGITGRQRTQGRGGGGGGGRRRRETQAHLHVWRQQHGSYIGEPRGLDCLPDSLCRTGCERSAFGRVAAGLHLRQQRAQGALHCPDWPEVFRSGAWRVQGAQGEVLKQGCTI